MSALLAGSMSSRPGEVDSAHATGVLVYAKDPVSRAGVASQLAGWRGIDLLDPRQGELAEVAVVVAETVDEEVLRVIRTIRRGSQAQVVLVVTDVDERAASTAAEAGAMGLLQRRAANGEQLASVIGRVRQGILAMPPVDERRTGVAAPGGTTPRVAARPDQPAEPGHRLSARDIDVLRLLSEGCDTADIAQKLAYSEPTIKNVIQRLFDQLKVRNRPHAVAVAMRAGII